MARIFSNIVADIDCELVRKFPDGFDYLEMIRHLSQEAGVDVLTNGDQISMKGVWAAMEHVHNLLTTTLAIYGTRVKYRSCVESVKKSELNQQVESFTESTCVETQMCDEIAENNQGADFDYVRVKEEPVTNSDNVEEVFDNESQITDNDKLSCDNDNSDLAEEDYTGSLESILDEDVTYEVVEGGTKRGGKKLVSSEGFSFTLKRSSATSSYWICSVRNKHVTCNAKMVQTGEDYTLKGQHNHDADPAIVKKIKISAKVKQVAKDDVFRSARVIVEETVHEMGTDNFNVGNLKRQAYRQRQSCRSKEQKQHQQEQSLSLASQD